MFAAVSMSQLLDAQGRRIVNADGRFVQAALGGPCECCEPQGDPLGACCKPNATCVQLTEADCIAANGFWLGDGFPCTPFPCSVCKVCDPVLPVKSCIIGVSGIQNVPAVCCAFPDTKVETEGNPAFFGTIPVSNSCIGPPHSYGSWVRRIYLWGPPPPPDFIPCTGQPIPPFPGVTIGHFEVWVSVSYDTFTGKWGASVNVDARDNSGQVVWARSWVFHPDNPTRPCSELYNNHVLWHPFETYHECGAQPSFMWRVVSEFSCTLRLLPP